MPVAQSLPLGYPGTNSLNVDIATITAGVHQLGVRVKDTSASWSEVSWLPVELSGAPTILLNGQVYSNNVVVTTNGASYLVTLQSRFPNANIFYSTNDSEPGIPYLAPFSVMAPFSIRALAYDENFLTNNESSSVFSLSILVGGGGNLGVAVQVNPTNGLSTATLSAIPLPGWSLFSLRTLICWRSYGCLIFKS